MLEHQVLTTSSETHDVEVFIHRFVSNSNSDPDLTVHCRTLTFVATLLLNLKFPL